MSATASTTTPVAALAGANLSPVKNEFIKLISDPQITDEQISELYEYLISRNDEQTASN